MITLAGHKALMVNQVRELAELFGFETRNKYQVSDENGQAIAYAAEQQKGLLGFVLRQFLGHWRTFDLQFFTPDRRPFMKASHPFRFFFQRLDVEVGGRPIGAIQQRWVIFGRRFDVEGPQGQVLMTMFAGFWKIWSFPFKKSEREVALVAKKWSGALNEIFTDKDRFRIEYKDQTLNEDERHLILAAALFIDLKYFEKKAD